MNRYDVIANTVIWIGLPSFYIFCWPAVLGIALVERRTKIIVSGPRVLLSYGITAVMMLIIYAICLHKFL